MLSAEDLVCRDDAQHFRIHPIAAVGVKETPAVPIRFQIEGKGPKRPKQIHVPIADAAVADIDKGAEVPTIQQDIRQAKVSVKQGICL